MGKDVEVLSRSDLKKTPSKNHPVRLPNETLITSIDEIDAQNRTTILRIKCPNLY